MFSESLVLLLTQIFAAASLAIMVIQLIASRRSRNRADKLLEQLEVGRREYRLMQYRATSNKTMMEISTIFIGSTQDTLDDAVYAALEHVGDFFNVERSSVLLVDEDSGTFSCINEWCKKGVSKQFEVTQNLKIECYPWLCGKINSREPVLINELSEVPKGSVDFRKQLNDAATKSMLLVPLINRDQVLGCLRIETTAAARTWTVGECESLNMIGEILASELSHLQAEQDIRNSQRNFQNMIAYAPVAMFVINHKGVVQYAEGRAVARAGFIGSQLVGQHINVAFKGNNTLIDSFNKAVDGVVFHAKLSFGKRQFDGHFTPVREQDSSVKSVVITAIDTSDRAQFEERLAKEKLYDNITGLPNRLLLLEKLIGFREKHRSGFSERGYLFVIAVNRSAPLHSALGSTAMHEMLRQISDRLVEYFANDTLVAHIGEYDFAVLTEQINSNEEALEMARELQLEFEQPLFLESNQLNITCSIGIAQNDSRQDTGEDWLSEAQTACVSASKDGGNTERLFHPTLASEALNTWQLSEQLKQAILDDQIQAWLQPIVNMETRKPIGFEALARWEISPGNFIPPNQFIPIAEEYGLIEELGNIMLRKSCKLLSKCHQLNERFNDLYISVNVASSQLEKESFLTSVKRLVETNNLQPSQLQLEITEREAVNPNKEVIPILQQARELGFKIALDDFGTGYNSLSYLNNLPATALKIDRSFIVGMEHSTTGTKVISSIVELAQTIELATITEGIETEEQREKLLAMGCSSAQGFLFSRPLSPTAVNDYLLELCETSN